jgi:hypothetical protein
LTSLSETINQALMVFNTAHNVLIKIYSMNPKNALTSRTRTVKGWLWCMLLALLLQPLTVQAQDGLQSPSEYLGYQLGTQFTPHYKIYDYFYYVADQSPMVQVEQFGSTYEGKPQILAYVGTESNMQNLDAIRTNNLKRTGLIEGSASGDGPAIVWLSYNVHGNEAVSSEAAMQTIYELVRPDRADTKSWLENAVVIMDPMLNPDGRDRYVNWYNNMVGEDYNANPAAREHHAPWPSGRTNHYYFDMNRDWAWMIQQESQNRIEEYQKWMPMVHVDFHEQGYNEPYYFAPAASPFHHAITEWQKKFQTDIGKNHTKYFDKNNWFYFTRQRFDLFYPSYGDTWPTFNGSIGMTYEQGGIGAGLGVETVDGDTLTLQDRIAHHTITGLSTVEASAKNRQDVISNFTKYFRDTRENGSGEYKSFVIRGDNNPDKLRALVTYLDKQEIQYGVATDDDRERGFNYRTGKEERFELQEGKDIIVNTYQPKGVLARVLFEPKPALEDSVTYDITAWELPYSFGVDAYAVKDKIEMGQSSLSFSGPVMGDDVENPYAYVIEWDSYEDVSLLTDLLNAGVKVRVGSIPFTTAGHQFDRGSLILTRNGNQQLGDRFDQIVKNTASTHLQPIWKVASGYVTSGADFGSSDVKYMEAPHVALLSGEGTSQYSVGEVWHYFDQQVDYPITMIGTDYADRIDWSQFDVIIMPDGWYSSFGNGTVDQIKDWVSNGGRLIALDGAVSFFAGKDGFGLSRKNGKTEGEKGSDPTDLQTYAERERNSITGYNTGSVFKVDLDNTHPLGYGMRKEYFSLKLNSDAYNYLESGWNVGVVKDDAHVSGFIGYKAKNNLKQTLVYGEQPMGRGSVIYMVDNPLFRGFWHNGKLIFANAVFMSGLE